MSHSATQTWQADPETCLWIAWISSIRQSLTSPRPHSAPAMLILSLSPARFVFLRRLRPALQPVLEDLESDLGDRSRLSHGFASLVIGHWPLH